MSQKLAFFRLRQLLCNRRHRRAGVALIVGLSSPVLIGTTGFAVDAAFWITQHTALQSATDAAAIKAARDLAIDPAATDTMLKADALTAANQAADGEITLTSSELTLTHQADIRQVQVSATIPGQRFFSQYLYPEPVNISARSIAGVAYSLVSTQATCYQADSYTYLYSTGFGTIDTAHSAGLDPFSCGSPPSPPAVYDSYCGGGVLGCSLDFLNAGNFLLPFAIQLGPNGGTGGLSVVLAPVVNTLTSLLTSGVTGTGSMTFVGPGTPYCAGNVCTVPPGAYNGGLTIEAGVTANFGNGYFLIMNGNLVVSTQASIPANNAIFTFGGSHPGALVEATQLALNTAALNSGAIMFSSAATFKSSSLIGTQTSAPLSATPYAQAQAVNQGLLSLLGTPGQNLVGTNFESAISTCVDATSQCTKPQNEQAIFQSTLIPSVAILQTLLPNLQPINLLSNEGETSTTTITSGVTLANGVPTDWSQSESANSTLTNTLQTVPALLSELGITGLTGTLVSAPLQLLINLIAPTETNSQFASAGGTFAGQTSVATPSCSAQPTLYSTTITPAYGPGFTDILQTAGESGASSPSGAPAISVSDSITICGTEPAGVATISPLGSNTQMVASTAGGASTITLMP